MYEKIKDSKRNRFQAVGHSIGRGKNHAMYGFELSDNRTKAKSKTETISGNVSASTEVTSSIQRKITEVDSWSDFQSKYFEKYHDVISDVFEKHVDLLIADEKTYSFDEAWDKASELALKQIEDFGVCEIKLSTLIPLLDTIQHRPDLVSYNQDTKKIEQKNISEDNDSKHYKGINLQDIADVQNLATLDETKIKPIFFSEINGDVDSSVRTGDGRHRIAVYHAMGLEWIKAELRPSQKKELEGRSVEFK